MAVLIEAISVVVRRKAIEQRHPGGWQGFLRRVPNRTLCTDGTFVRVGFMSPNDVQAYASTLEECGLVFRKDGQAVDFAVVDQLRGPTIPAPWLEFGRIQAGSMKIAACWPVGQFSKEVSLPEGWKYDGSMSDKPMFAKDNTMDDRLKFLRRENDIDVYLDLRAGKEVFTGRPTIAGEGEPVLFTRLEKICHETLKIEAQMQPLQALKDEQGLLPLFNRLNQELLPAAMQILKGTGRQMSSAHFTVGLILRILDRRAESERAFRKANELQRGAICTLRELVRCLGEQGKHREALPYAREAVEVHPLDAGAWGNLAMCLIQCGEREEARLSIDEAIALDPQDPINRYIRDNFESYF